MFAYLNKKVLEPSVIEYGSRSGPLQRVFFLFFSCALSLLPSSISVCVCLTFWHSKIKKNKKMRSSTTYCLWVGAPRLVPPSFFVPIHPLLCPNVLLNVLTVYLLNQAGLGPLPQNQLRFVLFLLGHSFFQFFTHSRILLLTPSFNDALTPFGRTRGPSLVFLLNAKSRQPLFPVSWH